MIDAKKAREQASSIDSEAMIKIRREIEEGIDRTSKQGNRRFNAKVPLNFHEVTYQWLNKLGYRVSCGDDQREGPWFIIQW